MFDALIHSKIETKGYEFELEMEDIDLLNRRVKDGDVDFSKISYANYPNIANGYEILSSGSALGSGNGPLLVSKHKIYPDEISSLDIAIPGVETSANLLLSYATREVKSRKVYLFSDISEAILTGEVDAGVLIHEERFSYMDKGLRLVLDLGANWEQRSGFLVPLGAIVIKKSLPQQVKQEIEQLIVESVQFAFTNPSSSYNFVRQNAKELSDETITKHIEMFVNSYSLDLNDIGRESVIEFLKLSGEEFDNNIFV